MKKSYVMTAAAGSLAFALAMGSSLSVAQAGWQEGVALYDNGEYEEAFAEFMPLVNTSQAPYAYYYMARMYENGQGVPADIAKALTLYYKAAQAGDLRSAVELGSLYISGEKFKQNVPLGKQWFEYAAAKGNPVAMYNLGMMYMNGFGVKNDYKKAFDYLRSSASKGYALSQREVGLMLYDGKGAPQDYTMALRYLVRAANQGNIDAQMNLGDLLSNTQTKGAPINMVQAHKWYNIATAYGAGQVRQTAAQKRDALVARMSPEEIAEAQRQASAWKPEIVYAPTPELGAKTELEQAKEQAKEQEKAAAKAAEPSFFDKLFSREDEPLKNAPAGGVGAGASAPVSVGAGAAGGASASAPEKKVEAGVPQL